MSYLILNSRALLATITVLKLISTAPMAGLSRIPALAGTTAANGPDDIVACGAPRFCAIFLSVAFDRQANERVPKDSGTLLPNYPILGATFETL